MKLLHLSDLHLGIKICEMSMIQEQRYIFEQIFEYLHHHPVDAVLLSGDIYDKSIPPVEAVLLFDEILQRLTEMEISVIMISGNHDSADRLSFGAGIMKKNRIWIGTKVEDAVYPVTLHDEYGAVNFYLLPFLRPVDVNNAFGQSLNSYTAAVDYMIRQMKPDTAQRNIILSHQFVAGAGVSDSEITVGGTESVEKTVYDPFDYVALGHLHTPQNVGSDKIRYCGTPLKYSLSEIRHQKSMSLITLMEKGHITIDKIPLIPLHDMKKLTGTFQELTNVVLGSEDYIYVELTDEQDIPYAAQGLRQIYPNLISVSYKRKGTRLQTESDGVSTVTEEKTPREIFEDLFSQQHPETELTDLQRSMLTEMIDKVWG